MKAKHIAVVLSVFLATHPLYAEKASIEKKLPIASHVVQSNKIDLNKADVAMLTGSIKGIGKKRAEAIVAYRETHQGFKSLDELAEVKGIGQNFIERNRAQLSEVFVVK